jgi:hypothetical protein
MPEEVEEELTDVDMSHFCNGDPVYCYYFRVPSQGWRPRQSQNPAEAQDLQWEMSLLAGMLDGTSMKPDRSLPRDRRPEHETL